MKRFDLRKLLGGVAMTAAVLFLAPSTMARAANDTDEATRSTVIDCSDPAAAVSSVDDDVMPALPGVKPSSTDLQVGGTCRLEGSGPFSYCTGECRFSHYQCEQVVTSSGITCGCRIPIRQ